MIRFIESIHCSQKSTTKDVKKGTGLGLYVTREIIQGLNGTIDISSKVGIGTKFTVYIPFVIE